MVGGVSYGRGRMAKVDDESTNTKGGLVPLYRRNDHTVDVRMGAHRRWYDSLLPAGRRRTQSELIAALNDVAAAVSSTISLDEVLETIVERAKWITNTEKAALLLTEDHSQSLDIDTLVVKGSREEHPQGWWAAQLQAIADQVFASGKMHLDLDHENDAWLLCCPIMIKQRAVGLLAAINSRERRFTHDQVDFLAILSAFAASAIENARLAEQTKYVLLSGERDRIAREMHDGISQSLFGVALGLEVCRKQVHRDPHSVATRLEELQEMVDVSRSELRRFIYDLRPVKLQELGLVGAIEYWVHEVTAERTIKIEVEVKGEPRTLTPVAEACLYRVAKESTSNVVKHAEADHAKITVAYEPDSVVLTIADDGRGFERQVVADISDFGQGIGLRSVEERVRRERGELQVVSSPGNGTRVQVRLPV